MKIRWKIDVAGTVHGKIDGVRVGDVMEVDDENGADYCRLGYAVPVVELKEERAVAPKSEERKPKPRHAVPPAE